MGFTFKNSESTSDAALSAVLAKHAYLRAVTGKNSSFTPSRANVDISLAEKRGNQVIDSWVKNAEAEND